MEQFLLRFKTTLKNAYLRVALVIFAIATIGLSTIDKYGVSADEITQINAIKWNYDRVTIGQPIPSDLKYYGIAFDATAEAVFQIQEYIRKGSFTPLVTFEYPKFNKIFLQRIKVKHVLTFVLALITYVSVAGIVGIFGGIGYAWVGPLVLALFPTFWGHSFFNPKDIPFAALFTLSIYLGSYLVAEYIQEDKPLKIGINPITFFTIAYGILMGLTTGIRIGGLALPLFVLIAFTVVGLSSKNILKKFYNLAGFYALMIVAWIAATNLCYPNYWFKPIKLFNKVIGYQSQHGWLGHVLFDGKFIPGDEIPWYYIPQWISITVPVIFQIFFIIGLDWILRNYPKFSGKQKVGSVLILLQIFFLPSVAIVKQSTIYDAIRHFIFVLPAMAAISALGIVWIYKKLHGRYIKTFAIASIVVALMPITLDMAALHPYEYVYFNRLSGGLINAHDRYDSDYWGLSTRAAIEWINKNGEHDAKIILASHFDAARVLAKPSITFVTLQDFTEKKVKLDPPYYYVALLGRGKNLNNLFPECPLVYQAARQNVPLTVVKQCD
jgi:hypothetical protein